MAPDRCDRRAGGALRDRIFPRTRLHLIAAAFVLASAIWALFAENTYLALYGDRDRYLGLTFVVDMAVLYLAVAVERP